MNQKIKIVSVVFVLSCFGHLHLEAAMRSLLALQRFVVPRATTPLLPTRASAPQLFLPLPANRAAGLRARFAGLGALGGRLVDSVGEGIAEADLPATLRACVVIPVAQEYLDGVDLEGLCDQLEACDLEQGYGHEYHERKKPYGMSAVVDRAIEFIQDHKATSFMMSTAAVSFVAAGTHFPHTLPVMLVSALASAGLTCGVSWFFKRQHDLNKVIEEALRSGAWSVVCMGVNVGVVLPIGEEILGTLATRTLSGASLSALAETIRSSDKVVVPDQSRINFKDVGVCAVFGGLGGVAAVAVATGKEMIGKIL